MLLSPLITRKQRIDIVGNLSDQQVACLASNHLGSNFETYVCRECDLIYLKVLRRLSWSSLACMCTNHALMYLFIPILITNATQPFQSEDRL